MKLLLKVAVLSTCCLALTAASCEPKRVVTALPIPPERMDCVHVAKRPTVPAEYRIDWNTVAGAPSVTVAVERAKAEVAKLMATIRTREGIVAGYVLEIEGRLFACSNDAAWLRQWNAETAR